MHWGIPFILASASPRRRELLKYLLDDFSVEEAKIEERLPKDIDLGEAVACVAAQKARAVAALHKEACTVLGADTMVVLDGQPMGKPKNEEDAERMLSSLSNRTHEVYTGVCLIHQGRELLFFERTEVEFGALSREEISENIKTGEPMDKAGAYAIQGTGGTWVKSVHGCFTNVIGLPMEHVREVLQALAEGRTL